MRSINECSHCAWNNHFGKMSHCSKIFIDHKIKLMWHLLVFFFSALRKKSARRQPNRRKKSFIQTVKQNFMAECLKHFNFIYYFLPVSTVFLVVKFYVFHKWNSVTEKKTAFQISMIHESRNMPAKLLRLIDFHCFPHFQYAIHFTMLFYRAVIVLPGHFIQKEIHSIIIITCAIKSKWRLLKWNNDYDDCNKNQYFAPKWVGNEPTRFFNWNDIQENTNRKKSLNRSNLETKQIECDILHRELL